MRFAVTVVSPPRYFPSAAFRDVAESIHYGLQALGHDSVLTSEGNLPGRKHIVLGANLLLRHPIPLANDAILYNLEQVDAGSSWFPPQMIDVFRRYTVWDYNNQNVLALESLGVRVAHVLPIGYVKELTRITHAVESDVDVLFIGSMNSRREKVLDELYELGLRVGIVTSAFGEERDSFIGRAKLMLNLHYYESKILEMVRISYLLANHCAVLSEHSADPSEDNALADGVAFSDYSHIARRARELVDSPEERAHLARRGFEVMNSCSMIEYLGNALRTLELVSE